MSIETALFGYIQATSFYQLTTHVISLSGRAYFDLHWNSTYSSDCTKSDTIFNSTALRSIVSCNWIYTAVQCTVQHFLGQFKLSYLMKWIFLGKVRLNQVKARKQPFAKSQVNLGYGMKIATLIKVRLLPGIANRPPQVHTREQRYSWLVRSTYVSQC